MSSQKSLLPNTVSEIQGTPTRAPSFPSRCVSLWRRALPRRLWAAEAGSLFLGAGVILAMGLVLRAFNGRPVGDWNFSMTLNSFIALLVTFVWMLLVFPLGSSLGQIKWNHFYSHQSLHDFQMIDQASRGVLGSIRICLTRPTMRIAPLAAVLTILISAIGPFTQQVLDIGFVIQQVSDTAALPVADPSFVWSGSSHNQIFNSTSPITSPFGVLTKDAIFNNNNQNLDSILAPPYLTSAMYSGIFSSEYSKFSVQPNCATSNCTWPFYNMLSFHSECTDISEKVQLNKTSFNISTSDANNTLVLLPNGNNVTFYQAMGDFVQDGKIVFSDDLGTFGYIFKTVIMSPSETPLVYHDGPDTVLTIQIIYLETQMASQQKQANPATAVNIMKAKAIECSTGLKAQPMAANITNSVFSEEAKAAPVGAEPLKGSAISPRTLVATSLTNETLRTCSYNTTSPSEPGSQFFADCDGYVVQDVQFNVNGTQLGIGPAAAVSLANSAAGLFSGNGTVSINTADVGQSTLTANQDIQGLVNSYTSDVMKTFLSIVSSQAETNVSLRDTSMTVADTMNNVANSLTTSLRSAVNSPAYGTAFIQQTVYRVQWPWFSIPVTMLVLTSLLTAVTAFDTWKKGMPVWTDSSIAIMAHGLAGIDRENLLPEKDADKLHDAAKDIKVQLVGGGQSLQSGDTFATSKHGAPLQTWM